MDHRRNLSKRERQLVDLAARGLTDHAIAHELGISPGTVATYWGRIRSKYGGSSRTEIVVHVLQEQSDEVIQGLRDRATELSTQLVQETQEGNVYHEVFEQAPESIVCVDAGGTIQNLNSSAEAQFGYSRSELVGSPIELLIPEEHRAEHVKHREAYMSHPERRYMDNHKPTFARHKSGAHMPILTTLTCIQTSDGPLVACFVDPMTTASSK